LTRIYAFVMTGDAGKALVIDKGEPYLNNQLNGLIFAYRALAPRQDHAAVVGRDEIATLPPSVAAYAWSPRCDCFEPTSVERQSAVREIAPSAEQPAPTVDVEYDTDDRTMRWRAGPYERGTWTIRYESAPGLWTIKYDAWRRTGGANVFWPDAERPFRFLVRFESADGWAVRTPVLQFTPATDRRLSWSPASAVP
jgi:hypothetical protein